MNQPVFHGMSAKGFVERCPLHGNRRVFTNTFSYPKMGGIRKPMSAVCTWNLKHLFINGCFNWMIPNHYIRNGCFTKHPFKSGCSGYQVDVRPMK